jgi:hypothetical protein
VCKHLEGEVCRIYEDRPLLCRVDESYDALFSGICSRDLFHCWNYDACVRLLKARPDGGETSLVALRNAFPLSEGTVGAAPADAVGSRVNETIFRFEKAFMDTTSLLVEIGKAELSALAVLGVFPDAYARICGEPFSISGEEKLFERLATWVRNFTGELGTLISSESALALAGIAANGAIGAASIPKIFNDGKSIDFPDGVFLKMPGFPRSPAPGRVILDLIGSLASGSGEATEKTREKVAGKPQGKAEDKGKGKTGEWVNGESELAWNPKSGIIGYLSYAAGCLSRFLAALTEATDFLNAFSADARCKCDWSAILVRKGLRENGKFEARMAMLVALQLFGMCGLNLLVPYEGFKFNLEAIDRASYSAEDMLGKHGFSL